MNTSRVAQRLHDPDLHDLGAHVSNAGGIVNVPGRVAQLNAVVGQLFTKQPSRWAEPVIADEVAQEFRRRRSEAGIRALGAHDSYLINLATDDPVLYERSAGNFTSELQRCADLGLDFLVTHPGNATGGDVNRGIARNADAITRALRIVGDAPMILLETTAGSGTALGRTFEELAAIIDSVGADVRDRVGICIDTCHIWAAGYDIRDSYESVMDRLEEVIGIERVGAFHFNDSRHPLMSRKDRHAHIGEGMLGLFPFRRILNDHRFHGIPKLLETPKDDDALEADRRNLAVLGALRPGGAGL